MADGKPNRDELAERLQTVTAYVRDCERRVLQGDIMDLQGLDNNVLQICEDIAKLPQQDAQELEEPMQILIAGLETLANAMRAHDEQYEEEK